MPIIFSDNSVSIEVEEPNGDTTTYELSAETFWHIATKAFLAHVIPIEPDPTAIDKSIAAFKLGQTRMRLRCRDACKYSIDEDAVMALTIEPAMPQDG